MTTPYGSMQRHLSTRSPSAGSTTPTTSSDSTRELEGSATPVSSFFSKARHPKLMAMFDKAMSSFKARKSSTQIATTSSANSSFTAEEINLGPTSSESASESLIENIGKHGSPLLTGLYDSRSNLNSKRTEIKTQIESTVAPYLEENTTIQGEIRDLQREISEIDQKLTKTESGGLVHGALTLKRAVLKESLKSKQDTQKIIESFIGLSNSLTEKVDQFIDHEIGREGGEIRAKYEENGKRSGLFESESSARKKMEEEIENDFKGAFKIFKSSIPLLQTSSIKLSKIKDDTTKLELLKQSLGIGTPMAAEEVPTNESEGGYGTDFEEVSASSASSTSLTPREQEGSGVDNRSISFVGARATFEAPTSNESPGFVGGGEVVSQVKQAESIIEKRKSDSDLLALEKSREAITNELNCIEKQEEADRLNFADLEDLRRSRIAFMMSQQGAAAAFSARAREYVSNFNHAMEQELEKTYAEMERLFNKSSQPKVSESKEVAKAGKLSFFTPKVKFMVFSASLIALTIIERERVLKTAEMLFGKLSEDKQKMLMGFVTAAKAKIPTPQEVGEFFEKFKPSSESLQQAGNQLMALPAATQRTIFSMLAYASSVGFAGAGLMSRGRGAFRRAMPMADVSVTGPVKQGLAAKPQASTDMTVAKEAEASFAMKAMRFTTAVTLLSALNYAMYVKANGGDLTDEAKRLSESGKAFARTLASKFTKDTLNSLSSSLASQIQEMAAAGVVRGSEELANLRSIDFSNMLRPLKDLAPGSKEELIQLIADFAKKQQGTIQTIYSSPRQVNPKDAHILVAISAVAAHILTTATKGVRSIASNLKIRLTKQDGVSEKKKTSTVKTFGSGGFTRKGALSAPVGSASAMQRADAANTAFAVNGDKQIEAFEILKKAKDNQNALQYLK